MDKSDHPPQMLRREWLLLILGLTVFMALAYFSSAQKSASFDEQFHLGAGYAYLKTGDFRLSNSHPPLIALTAALPFFGRDDIVLPLEHPSWEQSNRFLFGDQFLWQANLNPQELLETARIPIMLLGVILITVIFAWTRQAFGRWAGWLAFALALLDPNLIANARLVTSDLGLTCLLFLTMWSFWNWLKRPHWLTGLVVGILAGLTATAKYTGLMLVPLVLLCALLYPAVDRRNLGRRLLSLIGIGVIGMLTIWAVYRFDWGYTEWLPIVVPAPYYWQSLGDTFIKLPIVSGDKLSYLLGQVSLEGWWYYFPIALGVKTPLPTLILLSVGIVSLVRSDRIRRLACIWLPPLSFLLLGMTGVLTIGFRHILPAVPFLIMLAGWGGGALLERTTRARPWPAIAVGGLLLWTAVTAGRIYPHQEAYFNEIAGDWPQWSKILVDSNLDWGQDLIALQKVLLDHGIEEVNLAYFGMGIPEKYGIRYRPLPGYLRFGDGPEIFAYNPVSPAPGWYAISATLLRLGTLSPETKDYYQYFSQLEPIDRAGYSIYLYHVEDDRPAQDIVVAHIPVAQASLDPEQRTIARWTKTEATKIFPRGENFEANFQLVDADFENRFRLLGYEILNSHEIRAGTNVELKLYWQVGERPILSPTPATGPPLAAFVHVTAGEPWQIVAQYDGWETAVRGLEPGDIIAHYAPIPIGDGVPPAEYDLLLGLYSPQTSERLILDIAEDSVFLSTLTVNP